MSLLGRKALLHLRYEFTYALAFVASSSALYLILLYSNRLPYNWGVTHILSIMLILSTLGGVLRKVFWDGGVDLVGGGFRDYGLNIASIVDYILLSLVYFIGVGSTHILAKVAGKRFLDLGTTKYDTFWLNLERKEKSLEDHYRQF